MIKEKRLKYIVSCLLNMTGIFAFVGQVAAQAIVGDTHSGYSVAAYVWPSCHDDRPKGHELLWPAGTGEWENTCIGRSASQPEVTQCALGRLRSNRNCGQDRVYQDIHYAISPLSICAIQWKNGSATCGTMALPSALRRCDRLGIPSLPRPT